MEIALFIATGLVLAYMAGRQRGLVSRPEPSPPLIDHVLYAGDPRTDRLIRLDIPAPGQPYRLLSGQFVRLHWQVLHAEQIRISGIGSVQAIGSHDLFPTDESRIRIEASNRYRSDQQTVQLAVLEIPQPDIRPRAYASLPPIPGFPVDLLTGLGQIIPLEKPENIKLKL